MECWIGVDPGGIGAYGVAILFGSTAKTVTLDSTLAAIDWIENQLKVLRLKKPLAVGIDAPLWWSAGEGGGRAVDAWLRKSYKGKVRSSTIQSVNSLKGAALAQGMLFGEEIRKQYKKIKVTETHPKALLRACYGNKFKIFCHGHGLSPVPKCNDHEKDAIISAVAAREGFSSGRWVDLSQRGAVSGLDPLDGEQDPKKHWLVPVHYWWPIE